MRFYFSAFLLPALLLTSCANEGVIVRKDSSAMPFYHTLGIDGSYKLALRDNAGAVRSQLVTPEVYQGYAEGEYFNDLQPASTQPTDAKDVAAVTPGTATTQPTLAGGRSLHGNRLVGNGSGTGRSSLAVKAHKAPTVHPVASAQKSPSPALEEESAVVSAHFALPVQKPVHPVSSKLGESASTREIVAKLQTAPRVPSVALKGSQQSVVASGAPRTLTNQAAAARTLKPSNHIVSSARRVPSGATVATSVQKNSSLTLVSPQTHPVALQPAIAASPRVSVQPVAPTGQTSSPNRAIASKAATKTPAKSFVASKNPSAKKGAKSTAIQKPKRRPVSSSEPAREDEHAGHAR